MSEFTCPGSFDEAIHLSPKDISFNKHFTVMYINIKASKTDPFRSGCVIRLAAIRDHKLCPVAAMRKYLAIRGMSPGPLFVFQNRVHLTRNYLVPFLSISLPGVPNLNTHSFRIGGASACLQGLLML